MEKFFYRVSGKDSLLSVAEKFGVPPAVVIRDNGLKTEISEGDILFIEKPRGKTYTVGVFDTIESVAARFNVSEERLKEINGVEYLFYGLKLLIPE